jgi:hypothetical protein
MSERKHYFSYSASGSAFGGIMTDPESITVPTQAMASLSPSGGYGTATVENFGIDGLLTVRKGTTTVQGDLKQTELTVTLEDINVMNRLTVARIVVHLVAQTQLGAYEATITPMGSLIEGLRVDGNDISIPCSAPVYDRYPGWTGLEQAYVEGALKGLIIAPGSLGAPCSAERLDGCETRAGNVKATLYSLEGYSGPYPVVNGGLRVKGLATLYMGEYRISKFSRRLNMLRVELGCDRSGSIGFGEGSGNGQWEPPD